MNKLPNPENTWTDKLLPFLLVWVVIITFLLSIGFTLLSVNQGSPFPSIVGLGACYVTFLASFGAYFYLIIEVKKESDRIRKEKESEASEDV